MIDFTDPYKFDTTVKCVSLVPTVLRLQEKNKKLEKQLEEANEVIKTTNKLSGTIDLIPLPYQDRRKVDGIYRETDEYLEKWGVK